MQLMERSWSWAFHYWLIYPLNYSQTFPPAIIMWPLPSNFSGLHFHPIFLWHRKIMMNGIIYTWWLEKLFDTPMIKSWNGFLVRNEMFIRQIFSLSLLLSAVYRMKSEDLLRESFYTSLIFHLFMENFVGRNGFDIDDVLWVWEDGRETLMEILCRMKKSFNIFAN